MVSADRRLSRQPRCLRQDRFASGASVPWRGVDAAVHRGQSGGPRTERRSAVRSDRWPRCPAVRAEGEPNRHRTLFALRGGARIGAGCLYTGTTFLHGRLTMEIPRLNGVIKALESGKPAFAPFTSAEINNALTIGGAKFDGVVFEMEHNPYDIKALRDSMQYMLNRRQIATSGSIAPAVAPFVRIPPNGGERMQWIAKQVLDIGVYGIVWAAVSPGGEGGSAVAGGRFPGAREAAYYEPAGQRGD